jgi:hypothetical protein
MKALLCGNHRMRFSSSTSSTGMWRCSKPRVRGLSSSNCQSITDTICVTWQFWRALGRRRAMKLVASHHQYLFQTTTPPGLYLAKSRRRRRDTRSAFCENACDPYCKQISSGRMNGGSDETKEWKPNDHSPSDVQIVSRTFVQERYVHAGRTLLVQSASTSATCEGIENGCKD